VSESEAHSDSLGHFERFPVRIRGSFGQLEAFWEVPSPNQGLIRTTRGLFGGSQSESGALSDSLRTFWRSPVRIRGTFGQLKDFLEVPSPNQGLIRTTRGLFGGSQSESGAHSDSLRTFWRFPVRIRGTFGQLGTF
jgi:hypothetical protein